MALPWRHHKLVRDRHLPEQPAHVVAMTARMRPRAKRLFPLDADHATALDKHCRSLRDLQPVDRAQVERVDELAAGVLADGHLGTPADVCECGVRSFFQYLFCWSSHKRAVACNDDDDDGDAPSLPRLTSHTTATNTSVSTASTASTKRLRAAHSTSGATSLLGLNSRLTVLTIDDADETAEEDDDKDEADGVGAGRNGPPPRPPWAVRWFNMPAKFTSPVCCPLYFFAR